jgi:hypothetical protein
MKHLSFQPNKNSGASSSSSSPSSWQLIIHSALLCNWAWYLSAKWLICVSSRSSHIWILSFLELLLAVPDLFSILEFTILFVSTPRSSHYGSYSTVSTMPPDATVHVLITCVRSTVTSNTKACTDELDQNMRRTHRRRHENRESRSVPSLP